MLNALLAPLFILVFYVLPLAIAVAIAVWVYNSVNRANATLEGIRDELRRLSAPVSQRSEVG